MQLGRRPVFFGLGLATLVGGFGRSAYSRRWRDRPQQTPHPLGGTAPTGDTPENAGSATANDTASPATIEGYCSATSVVQGGCCNSMFERPGQPVFIRWTFIE